jgi:hypothetical protein
MWTGRQLFVWSGRPFDQVGLECATGGERHVSNQVSKRTQPTARAAITLLVAMLAGSTVASTTAASTSIRSIEHRQSPSAAPIGDTTPPTVPTNLAASAVSTSQIDLTWTASTDDAGVQGYKLYRDGTYLAAVGPIGSASFSDTGLSPATAYSYRVSAIDAAGNESAQSTAVPTATLGAGGQR